MKMVHSQPVAKPGRSFGPEPWGKASSAAHWRPGSVLFPQQGSCHLLLHDGTVPCTGPGTRRVSVKASTRCRPNEARKAFSHFRLASAAVPENSPPTLHSRTCPVGGAVVKDRPQLTYEQANSGGGGESQFANCPPGVTIPSEPRGCRTPTRLRSGGRRRSQRSTVQPRGLQLPMQDHCRRPHYQVQQRGWGWGPAVRAAGKCPSTAVG